MSLRLAALVLAMVLSWSGMASAQTGSQVQDKRTGDDHVTRQVVPFLEGSYLFRSNQPHVIFEAAVFPHLVFWQNFDDLIDARLPSKRNQTKRPWRQYWAVSLTPGVRLKLLDAFSDPVRTPSYMPRADVQKLMAFGRESAVEALERGQATRVRLVEVHAAIEHHSNGQDGCLFVDQHQEGTDPATAKCVP